MKGNSYNPYTLYIGNLGYLRQLTDHSVGKYNRGLGHGLDFNEMLKEKCPPRVFVGQ